MIVTESKSFATVTWNDISEADPDFVVIIPCGYEIEKSLVEMRNDVVTRELGKLTAVTNGRCYVADGNAYFNRPGPRLADSAELLAAITHPTDLPDLTREYEGAYVRWPMP